MLLQLSWMQSTVRSHASTRFPRPPPPCVADIHSRSSVGGTLGYSRQTHEVHPALPQWGEKRGWELNQYLDAIMK